jgi:hypothetical protein
LYIGPDSPDALPRWQEFSVPLVFALGQIAKSSRRVSSNWRIAVRDPWVKPMSRNTTSRNRLVLVAALLAASVAASNAFSQSSQGTQNSTAGSKKSPVAEAGPRPNPNWLSRRAEMYYQGVWGVDSFRVKYTESGEIIRFSYRVVDPEKAAPLNDKKSEPTLIDPRAGVSLVVPEVSNVGKMRQTSTPKAGMTYWMAFSNTGRPVKRGDRVDVMIGRFRVTGLEVE